MITLHEDMLATGRQALEASHKLALLGAARKNRILAAMADELAAQTPLILAANQKDMEAGKAAGLSSAMLDRLLLTEARMAGIISAIQTVAALKDPVGARMNRRIRPNGLEIIKKRVPIGVIAIIYESRPNVTVDSAVLCFKTSNAVILRGGKEAIHSNAALADAMMAGGAKKGLPAHAIQLIRTTDREAIRELVQLEGLVDVVIPRGGEALIRAVTEQARVPVLKHYKGVCHVYVDADADLDMALKIVENAKCQRPGTCNAMESLLVHEKVAAAFLGRLGPRFRELGVRMRGDEAARRIWPEMQAATEADWATEYLDLEMSVRVVPSLDAATRHINQYGTRHSDAIVTQSAAAQKQFVRKVDSATVYVNASTRFTDGGEFGMGAEIGISTDKLHARGPMGLEELTTSKYIINGQGQIRG
jgi:glutamate-5-semialdehyde dehydrogenase